MKKNVKNTELLIECGLKASIIEQLPQKTVESLAIIYMDLQPLTAEKKNILIKLAFMALSGKPSAPILMQQEILSFGQLKELSNEQVEVIASEYEIHNDKKLAAKNALNMIMHNQHSKLNKKYMSYAISPLIIDDEDEASK